MASEQSPEARELALIGKLELRIATASTDRKLQDLLDTYLAALLLKLGSEHMASRNKVISICQHINKRIMPPQEIALPVKKLLIQFKEHADVPLIRHFDILYIQQGILRIPVTERLELLPILMNGIAADYNRSPQHASQLFHMTLRLLPHFKLPPRGSKEDNELREKLNLGDDDATFLSKWFGKLILLVVVRQSQSAQDPAPRCPGLSAEEYKFLTQYGKPETWDPTAPAGLSLIESKALVTRCLASGMFKDHEKLLPALFASADTNSRISEIGDDVLKRVIQAIDLEDAKLIEELFDIYFGSSTADGALSAKTPLRIKILGLLSRSVKTTTFPHLVSRIVEQGLLSLDETAAGREASKLRSAIFSLVNFVARRGASEDLASVADGLVGNLKAFVEDQGWPVPDRDHDPELRRYGYETIGLLAKASPDRILLEPNLSLLQWLFRSLKHDSSGKDVAVSIEEALSSVLGAFSKPFDSDTRIKFREILLKYSVSDLGDKSQEAGSLSRSTRYVAMRFANRCLPFDDTLARWINILALSGGRAERHEVIEEGKKGLDPYLFAMSNSLPGTDDQKHDVSFPDFSQLVQYIFAQRIDDDEMDIDDQNSISTQTRGFREDYPNTIPTVISFCTRVAVHEALVNKGIQYQVSQDWDRKLETLLSTDQRARQAFRDYASEDVHGRSLATILRASLDQLIRDEATAIGEIGNDFVLLCALTPEKLWKQGNLLYDLRTLLPSILANNPARRTAAAHVYGLLSSNPECDEDTIKSINQLLLSKIKSWKNAVGAEVNQVSGAVIALGYYFSRTYWRSPSNIGADHPVFQLLEMAIDILQNTRDSTLQTAVFSCFEQLCLFHIITPSRIAEHAKFQDVIDQIYNVAKSGTISAVIALGRFSMIVEEVNDGDTKESSDYGYVADKLYKLHEIRQPEIQFSVGESLSCFAVGWNSKALTAELDIEHPKQSHDPWDAPLLTPEGPKRETTLSTVLKKTLQGCRQTKPSLKKASVIWLLCLLQYCGHKPEFQEYLPQCQVAFKVCLSDRDEVVQEASSRGLGIVYEKGDRQLKADLVRDLVSSFSDSKSKLTGMVSEDTELFEPGTLSTGDGSITTYKDILNLAAEVGDSTLVYQFMSMASHNSIWSSRAAFGRFGLSNIFSDSSVDGYLSENPKLYPKLYRYRFDPNTNVQKSMTDIWNALVKDTSATIEKHFDSIMDDLLISILDKEWRVREACCAAIADLVQGRKLEKYEKYLDQIWDKCFKVLDDIKETVRIAAAKLARVLTGILTRSLEAGDSSAKNASAMLSRVLPFLLSSSGLESRAEEVKLFAVSTLLEIVKKSNAKTLNPHSPELVERLLGLLSSLEPEAINYIHLNASKYNLTEQKLDDMRLQSVRSSPLTESIERCLDLADAETMKEMVPRIEAAIKNAVGLPSKVGCSRMLVTLSTRHNFLFKPYADGFLKLIQKCVNDRNETVSSSYAAAAGYVARLVSDKQLLSTIAFCHKLYFESEDDKNRLISGDIVLSISKNATDRFNSFASDLLPFIFVAKHDSHSVVKQLFNDTWSDNVAGSRTVLLYLKEIVTLADKYLESPKWVLKHTAAKTIADTVISITTGTEEISQANAQILWPALDKAMGGKTWEGKEVVLEAFVKFVERGKSLWGTDTKVAKQIEKVAIREAKRQNKAYRPFALDALGKIVRARTDLELSNSVIEIVETILDEVLAKEDGSDKMDVDGGEAMKESALQDQTLSAATAALLNGPNPDKLSPPLLASTLATILPIVVRATSTHAKEVNLNSFVSLHSIFERLPSDLPLTDTNAKEALEKLLFDASFEGLPEAMRVKRAEALVAIGKVKSTAWVREKVKPEVDGGERSPVVRAVLAKVGRG